MDEKDFMRIENHVGLHGGICFFRVTIGKWFLELGSTLREQFEVAFTVCSISAPPIPVHRLRPSQTDCPPPLVKMIKGSISFPLLPLQSKRFDLFLKEVALFFRCAGFASPFFHFGT